MRACTNLSKTSQIAPIFHGTVIAFAGRAGNISRRIQVRNTAAPTVTEADLARLEQLRNIPIESVADKASMLMMAATMTQCIQELAHSESDEETLRILGSAFQLLFMLGRQSVLH